MGFLKALQGLAGRADGQVKVTGESSDTRISGHPSDPTASSQLLSSDSHESKSSAGASLYDREQWRRKLKRILEKLPQTESEWSVLEPEGRALGFGEEWIAQAYVEELALMIRKIVSDRVVTADELHKIDRARSLMGITDTEAKAMLDVIVSEAEKFFGTHVEGA